MPLAKLSVRRPVLTTMLIMVFVVIGAFSYLRVKVDLFPEVTFPIVTITTIYPGAGPAEVESQVTKVLEDEVIAISNVRSVYSVSQENVSVISVEFELGTNVDFAAIDVKDKVDAIRFELPDDAEPPSVVKFDIQAMPVMDLAVSGDRPLDEIFDLADRTIKDTLSRVNGVSSVRIIGGQEREIQVALDNRKLKGYGLSIMDVVRAIAMANLSVPAGHIAEGSTEYSIRLIGEFDSLDDIRNLRIPTMRGPSVLLTDVGRVEDTFKDQRELARLNKQAAVGISVQKRSDSNIIETADGLLAAIDSLQSQLPSDVTISVIRDGSTFIRMSVRDVLISIGIGILLTAGVLFLFLHDLRSTIIAAIVMPASIIATFLLIDAAGFTLNLMSLLGLGISVGTLVANAIVVLENISRHIDRGDSPMRAAETGTSEVAVAVIASAMTNVMVFTPIGFMSGIVGQFFKQFGLTVVFATLFSLLVSFTLTPMLASRLLRPSGETARRSPLRGLYAVWDRLYGATEDAYRGMLDWTLSHRVLVTVVTLLAFVGGMALFRFVGNEFIPTFDQGFVRIGLEMPAGTSLDMTNRRLMRIEELARELPETKSVYTTLGGAGMRQGVEYGEVLLELKPDRTRTGPAILAALRETMPAAIPDAQLTFDLAQGGGRGGQADIEIEVTGDDMATLRTLAKQVRDIAKATPGAADVRMSDKPGKPELAIALNRRKLDRYHLTLAQVGGLLRASFTGDVATTYREGGEEYDVRVRLSEGDRQRVENVDRVLVQAGATALPLADLGTISLTEGSTQLTRKNKHRLITVEANIGEGNLGAVVAAIQRNIDQIDIPDGYAVRFGGQVERQGEAFASILTALILAILLTYMLLGAILESFVHPITIMVTLPLGLIGVSLALVSTGLAINIFSLMAVVMMVGIVVNNGILLLDYVGQLRQQGMSMREALLEACPTRLRPILMANLAIVAGMLPQALSPSGVAVVQASMATVLIGAVLLSTLFTMFVIPTVYTWLDRIAKSPRAAD